MDAICRLIPEAAPGPIAATFQYLLVQEQKRPHNCLGNALIMCEYGQDRKPGVPKTAEITDHMVRLSSTMMKEDRIWISENFISGLNTRPQAMLDNFFHQIGTFRCEVKGNKNDTFSTWKYKWCGDIDDMVVSFMMVLFWSVYFWESSYQGYKRFKLSL